MQSNKEADDDMISSHVTLLIKKCMPNPSNGTSNSSTLSSTYDTAQVKTSTQELKSAQDPKKMAPWTDEAFFGERGARVCLGGKNCFE